MAVYAYVRTKHPRWISRFVCLSACTQYEPRNYEPRNYPNGYFVPYRVEDVLDVLEYQSQQYYKARSHPWAAPQPPQPPWAAPPPPPPPGSLFMLPLHVLETEYIRPAIAMSRAEGPEREPCT